MVKIAVIPARGGSKRIPKKNMVNFDGTPLIEKTIRCALDSEIFDEVIVSTDDLEIAEFSESIGAFVPGLREIYQDDKTPSSKVTRSSFPTYANLSFSNHHRLA
jgi:N-acylneuraminate cytidylyltransferase